MTMTDHAKDYVASRKALGLSFMKQERVLMRYAEHADARGEEFVRINSVLDWAGTATSVREAQRRLQHHPRHWPSSSMSGITVTRCPTGTRSASRNGSAHRRAFRRRRRSGRS